MPNRIARVLLAICLLATLAACGSTASQNTSSTAVAPSVAGVTPTAEAATAAAIATTASTGAGVTITPATEATIASTAAGASTAAVAGARTFQIVSARTEARYEVQEQFLSRNLPSKAIGKTNAVTGQFQFSTSGKPTGKVTKITVDLRTLKSDDSRRDGRIRQQWLESDKYPYAEFTSTEVQNLPDNYTEGQEVNFKLIGDMKIHDVTKPVTFDVRGKLTGGTVTGTATTQIMMKDFGFDPPSIAGMLTVQDGVTIVVDFTAKEGSGS